MTHEPHDERVLLREFLSGRDARCPACGYNLRNTEGDRCPECGRTLALSVSTTPRLGAFICLIAAIAAPVGFAGTVAAPGWYRLFEHYRRNLTLQPLFGWSRADWINLAVSSGVVFVGLILLRMAAWQSRRLIALRGSIRWSIALCAIIISIGVIYGLIRCYAHIYSLDEEF